MGLYYIGIDPVKKEFTVRLEGLFHQDETAEYMAEFNRQLMTINPTEYTIIFDAIKFQVLPKDMHDTLKACFEAYKQIGFKDINMLMGENAILVMQVKRIAKEAGLNNFSIVG